MTSDDLPRDNDGLGSLFAKVPAPVVVKPDTPGAPITIRLTGDVAPDAQLLTDAYALRDAEELRLGHSVMVIDWDT